MPWYTYKVRSICTIKLATNTAEAGHFSHGQVSGAAGNGWITEFVLGDRLRLQGRRCWQIYLLQLQALREQADSTACRASSVGMQADSCLHVGWHASSLVLCFVRHVGFQSIQLAQQIVLVNVVRHTVVLAQDVLNVVVHILRRRGGCIGAPTITLTWAAQPSA